jgi:branched-subunit amino acid transport protein
MTMWIIIILCGAITFLIRFIPLSGLLPNELPSSINKSLKYIPIVILIPMIINSLSIVEGTEVYLFNNYKLYAALIAVIATIFFKNVFATIMIGMFSFIFMSNFL